MGYAISAIPIWLTKMAIMLGGLKLITTFGINAIEWIVKKFEKLLFFDFSGLFSGNTNNANKILNYNGSSDSFQFFPSPTSPFFILWIIFFSAAILLILIMILYTFVQRINFEEPTSKTPPLSKYISNIIAVLITIFFIPIVVFSSMTITSVSAKALFKTNSLTASKSAIQEYKNTFLSKNQLVINNIYQLGHQNTLTMNDNSKNALYSHSDNHKQDTTIDNIANKTPSITNPFPTFNSVINRLLYEFTFLEKNSASIFDSTTLLLITQTKQNLENYQKKWLSGSSIKNIFTRLNHHLQTLSISNKNEARSRLVDHLKNEIKKYHLHTLQVFNQLRELISKKNLIPLSLTDYLKESNFPFRSKLNNLFSNNNPTLKINILKPGIKKEKDEENIVLTTNQTNQLHKLIAFINIYSLTKVYLAPQSFTTMANWSTPFTYPKNPSWSSNSTLIDIQQNIQKMLVGYKLGNDLLSYQFLAQAFSAHKKTSLSKVIEEVSTIGNGDPIMAIIMVFISYAVIILVLTILYQLVKRLLERLLKLIWLWLVGPIIISTAIRSGTQSIKNWFSMVMTETIVLIGLGLGWEIWKILTPLMFNWIGSSQNTSELNLPISNSVQNITNPGYIIFKIFVTLILLELVIKSSDWLSNAMGGSPNFTSINSNIRGEISNIRRGVTPRMRSPRNLNQNTINPKIGTKFSRGRIPPPLKGKK